MYKIEVKGNPEHLKRISIFLENNHIHHDLVEKIDNSLALEELVESINWPI